MTEFGLCACGQPALVRLNFEPKCRECLVAALKAKHETAVALLDILQKYRQERE